MHFEVNENNELVLIESKTIRDELVYKDNVLDKVKFVSTLEGTSELTIKLAAEYYDVPQKTVEAILKRNRDEFNEYAEMRVLKGKALKDLKALLQLEGDLKTAPSLTLITRRGLLRIGMLLTESEVAKSIRHYLLNVEEISSKEQKLWAVEREISRRERRQLTDAIRDFYNGTMKTGIAYSVFTNLVYDILFDTNAEGLRNMYGLEKGDPLRDSLSTEDLRKVVRVEKTIAALLLLGKGKRDIETELKANKEKLIS